MSARVGRFYREFLAGDRKTRVALRAARWEDLDAMVEFANELASEHEADIDFGTLLSRPVTRIEESEWLAKKLVRIEQGKEVSVVAEVEGKVVGNSEALLGAFDDIAAHGTVGIAVRRGHRGMGIGTEMMKELIHQSRELGVRTLQLEVLSTNPRAASLYEGVGFERAGLLKEKVRRKGKSIDCIVMTMSL